ncbi:Nn.00g039650.m01.CDS01 [Neocucurbitaria sp. VM-36]
MKLQLVDFFGLIAISCALYLLYSILRFGHRDKRLPPGPPTLPILGNAHQIPAGNVHVKFKEWSDKYGRVFSLKIGAGTFIVLNDRRAVHDLLDKRSTIYSDRPYDHNSETCFNNENLSFMHTTPLWRSQRKIASQTLSPKSLDDKVRPIQEAEICQLINDLLITPDDFFKHIKRTTASVASIVLFGHRGPTFDDFWASAVYRAMEHVNSTLERGTYLPVEQFPILKYIPDRWAPSKKRAKVCYAEVLKIWTEARARVDARRKTGDERDSLADRMLSGSLKCDVPLSDHKLNLFLGAIHQAAADTTMTAMLTNILYLAKHPWVQEKARLELDRVCGAERMPVWEDFQQLPYINCIIKEGLRIRPVVPEGVPHRVSRDDWYEGMLIPKDAAIFVPANTLHTDYYEKPETYNPDRYLGHPRLAMDYAGSPDHENRDHYAYGAGRRICVGIHLAERTQWRITSRLLWAFKIEPKLDSSTGKPIDLDVTRYTDGFIRCPLPFQVNFVPRSEEHVKVIQNDFRNIRDFLKTWE